MEWYIARGDTRTGSYSDQIFRALVEKGLVQPSASDLVWHNWQRRRGPRC